MTVLDLSKVEFIDSGLYGSVYRLNDTEVVKVGRIESDIEFHNEITKLGAGLSLFPMSKGVGSFIYEEEEVHGLICEFVDGFTIQDFCYNYGIRGDYDRIDLDMIKKMAKDLIEELTTFSVETSIVVHDVHWANVKYDPNTNRLRVVDCGLWEKFDDEEFNNEDERREFFRCEVEKNFYVIEDIKRFL